MQQAFFVLSISNFDLSRTMIFCPDPQFTFNTNLLGSMLKSLQQKYINQGICGRATYNALGFYYRYNFKRMDERELYLLWQPQR